MGRWLRSLLSIIFCLVFIIFIVIIHVLFTALYLWRYRYVDIWSDLGSSGTVPRTFIQDPVACWLVATTACSCGFRTIDISVAWLCLPRSWFPEAPLPLRGWWVSSTSWIGSVLRPGTGRFFLTFLTFDFLTYGLTILLLRLLAWPSTQLVSLWSVCHYFFCFFPLLPTHLCMHIPPFWSMWVIVLFKYSGNCIIGNVIFKLK